MKNPRKFADLLTKAINRIHANENGMQKEIIRHQLGVVAGRKGRTAIDYWCQGRVPDEMALEKLAREIVRRKAFSLQKLGKFLETPKLIIAKPLLKDLFQTSHPAEDSTAENLTIQTISSFPSIFSAKPRQERKEATAN